MRSLFLKIFLWFWFTMVLVFAVLIVTWNLQPEVVISRWRNSTTDAVNIYAQNAAEDYDHDGQGALNAFFSRLSNSSDIKAGLYDESGKVLAGKAPDVTPQLLSEAPTGSSPEFSLTPLRVVATKRVVGPSGRTYYFIAEMPRGPYGAFRPTFWSQWPRWLLVVLISCLVCYWLTRYFTKPIIRLRAATRSLASGNLSARAGQDIAKRRDELGDLVRDFNSMANRIEDLLTSQQQLISDISHELRSPLARLNVALGLARQRAGDGAASALERIEVEADRLNDMIGQLLLLARMEGAVEPAGRGDVDLKELLGDVVSDAAYEAQEQNTNVRLIADGACRIEASAEQLRSALENVVRNGVRYTAPGTEVEVRLTCADLRNGQRRAQITVRDHGPGVPEPELPKIFQPFYRVTTARDRQTGGTGLGLAITDRAVRLHGGMVTATNAPGGGLQVKIDLPVSGVETPVPEPAHVA